MWKRYLILGALAVGLTAAVAAEADAAWRIRRIAPVRRVAARAALPPYPIARRAVVGPVYRPVVRPYYRAPVYYGRGVYIGW